MFYRVNEQLRAQPPSAPPNVTPQYCHYFHITTKEILVNNLNKYMYIWLYSGRSFWFFPMTIDEQFITGHVWNGEYWNEKRFKWTHIDSFY